VALPVWGSSNRERLKLISNHKVALQIIIIRQFNRTYKKIMHTPTTTITETRQQQKGKEKKKGEK